MTNALLAAALAPDSFRLPRLASPLYRVVFDQGRDAHGQTLALWAMKLPDADRRVGVVVSKKMIRRSVDRHRAKRLLRETFRLSRHHLKPGFGIVLVARAGIMGKKCQDVMRDFERICRRAKIWDKTMDGIG